MYERLPVGTVVYARTSYNGEFLHYHFYKIEGYTRNGVRITRIETETVYDDGKKGPHYYDDPYHVQPKTIEGKYVLDTDMWQVLRKIRWSSNGEMRFRPEECFSYQGVWDGQPLEAYNLH